MSWARAIGHSNTIGLVLCHGIALTNVWLRNVDRVETAAREAIQSAEEMSMAMWHTWAHSRLGWALAERGSSEGIAEMTASLREARTIGVTRLECFHLGLAAEALSRAGQHAEAKTTLAEAFTALADGHDMAFAADLHRIRAAVALRISADTAADAVADLQRALEIACQQEARSLELRAARDLARLWADQGERQRARDLLAPVYGWFTEGFDTPDLIEARQLLDEII